MMYAQNYDRALLRRPTGVCVLIVSTGLFLMALREVYWGRVALHHGLGMSAPVLSTKDIV